MYKFYARHSNQQHLKRDLNEKYVPLNGNGGPYGCGYFLAAGKAISSVEPFIGSVVIYLIMFALGEIAVELKSLFS
jgi:amino acid permease